MAFVTVIGWEDSEHERTIIGVTPQDVERLRMGQMVLVNTGKEEAEREAVVGVLRETRHWQQIASNQMQLAAIAKECRYLVVIDRECWKPLTKREVAVIVAPEDGLSIAVCCAGNRTEYHEAIRRFQLKRRPGETDGTL